MSLHHTADLTRRPGRTAPFFRAGVGVGFGALWISGCSVLYDLSTDQCSTNQDCIELGGAFAEFECREHLCQERLGCKSHAECMDMAGDSNPWACIDYECIQMNTTECPTMLPVGETGDLWRDSLAKTAPNEPLILAGTDLVGGTVTMGPRLANYDLALTELTVQAVGLKGGLRPVVMLGCKADPTPEELETEMAHLARLKIPAMASAFLADDLQNAFNLNNAADVDTKMFFLSAQDSDPTLALFADDGRIWHMGPSPDVIARAYAPLLTRVLTKLGLTTGVRVATVVASNERFLYYSNQTISSTPEQFGIVFNGIGAVANGENYKTVSVTLNEGASTAAVTDLLEFKPHVILSAAGAEFMTNIIPGVESGWPQPSEPGGDQPKPFYILSPYNADPSLVRTVLDGRGTLRERLVGINGEGSADPTLYTQYYSRLQASASSAYARAGTENYYDAGYFLMYAGAAAANSTSLAQGADFQAGMRRLVNFSGRGASYTVGPGQPMNEVLVALASSTGDIALTGTLGPPNFNLDGTRNSNGSVWCVDATPNIHSDVLRYSVTGDDASTATLTGDFPAECIPDF